MTVRVRLIRSANLIGHLVNVDHATRPDTTVPSIANEFIRRFLKTKGTIERHIRVLNCSRFRHHTFWHIAGSSY